MILSDLIHEELIVTDFEAENQFDALTKLYEKLYAESYVKESYLEGILKREEVFPTGIDLQSTYNVAIPHTDAEHVLRSSICLAILKKPIIFKKMDDSSKEIEVNIIFMIALNKQEKQVEVLEKLIGLITNKESMEKVLKLKTKKDIINLFINGGI